MNAINLLILLLLESEASDVDVVLQAITGMMETVYSQKTLYVLYDEATDKTMINDVLSKAKDVSVQIASFDGVGKQPVRRRNVLVFVESYEEVVRVQRIMSDQMFNFDGFYTIVCSTMSARQVDEMFRSFWTKFVYNVNLLSTHAGLVSLQTFIPFDHDKCSDTSSRVINTFRPMTLRWDSNVFFSRKLTNLHGCPIRITTFEFPPAVIASRMENGTIKLEGSDVEIINGLADALNFRVDLNFMPNFGDWGVFYDNGSATGAYRLLLANKSDIMIGWVYVSYAKSFHLANTEPYFMIPLGFIIPPGTAFSTLEKLLIPYETAVWITLLVLLAVAVCVILIVKRRAKKLRNFVVGREVASPFTELLVALFGGSSHALPRQQFPRYLLMMFLLFCLVMRTVYQGGLFKFMQSDQKGREVSSIDEMINDGFEIYAYESVRVLWKDMSEK